MKSFRRSIPLITIRSICFAALVMLSSSLLFAESKPADTLRASSSRLEAPLRPCPKSPNCVNSLYKEDQKHYIKAIKTRAPQNPDNTIEDAETVTHQNRDHLLEVLNTLEKVKVVQVGDNYIKAEFSSKVFSFVDDVEFLILPEKIEVRSASRTGYHDMGANRRRIEKIRNLFEQH